MSIKSTIADNRCQISSQQAPKFHFWHWQTENNDDKTRIQGSYFSLSKTENYAYFQSLLSCIFNWSQTYRELICSFWRFYTRELLEKRSDQIQSKFRSEIEIILGTKF